MDNDLDLPALRAFRAIIREGSISGAAQALNAPKSTISKRLADLETSLGVRLIERSTRKLSLTPEGEVLTARADRLLGEADEIRRALWEQGSAPKGHLRVAIPPVMGDMLMGGIAARFQRTYPEITLELHFLDRNPDLLVEGFDGCVRFGPLQDSGEVARLLLHGQAILVARPDLPGLDRLTHPDDLIRFALVGKTAGWNSDWPLVCGEESLMLKARPQLSLGSFLAIRDAVIEGAGISLIPHLLALPEIYAGRLAHILPEWSSPRKSLYFVYPSAQSITARMRVFIDFLIKELQVFEI